MGQGITQNWKHFLGQQEMENAWNEYLKLENDVEQLKQTLQEQHRRAFFFPGEIADTERSMEN